MMYVYINLFELVLSFNKKLVRLIQILAASLISQVLSAK